MSVVNAPLMQQRRRRCLSSSDSAAALVRFTLNSAAAFVWLKSTDVAYLPWILLCLCPTYFGFCFAFVQIKSTALQYQRRLDSLVLRPLGILQQRRLIQYTDYLPYAVKEALSRLNRILSPYTAKILLKRFNTRPLMLFANNKINADADNYLTIQ
jgi:hypothetical protein